LALAALLWPATAAEKPRTKHLDANGAPRFTNRLAKETSPYLRQHAHNPVDWYPWGDEAFERARRLNRPVFLSIGYSTCHWCHVMEEESFEDLEIAQYLNGHYVAIKVDREERPDIDNIYMTAVQAWTGRGGWPLNVWLAPDRRPFYGGTYFPPRDGDRGASLGFLSMLKRLKSIYDNEPERVREAAAHVTDQLRKHLAPEPGEGLPGLKVLEDAARWSREHFDPEWGGARGAPKFPSSLPHRFLLRWHRRVADPEILRIVSLTLQKMAAGGMYDQVGGGFHRYSTDQRWLVPHFEKMLYDNALLVMDYLEAHQATGRRDFAAVARDILRYLERDMSSPVGAFYSATDADSPNPKGVREEGWFFTWTPAEIEAVLGKQRAGPLLAYYAVTAAGNFEGRSILHAARDTAPPGLAQAREALYQARLRRPPPLRDEKILAAWNGLAISAFARAAFVLGDARYAQRAARAASFVLDRMQRDGRLLRSWKDGRAQHNGYLEDHAFLAAGLLDLFEATGDVRWLREAIRMDQVIEKRYEDAKSGGFFRTSDDHEGLLAREKPGQDGAEPSGTSVAVMNLLRLHQLTSREVYRRRAERGLRSVGTLLERSPTAFGELLNAVDFYLGQPKEIVIVAPQERREAEPFLARLRAAYAPHRVLVVTTAKEVAEVAQAAPVAEGKLALKGQTTAYVCEKGICKLPTSDPEVFRRQISGS
jgi:hypothetical protein